MKRSVLACTRFFLVLMASIITIATTAQSGPGGGNGNGNSGNGNGNSGPGNSGSGTTTVAPELVFTNPVLKSGNANKQGATYRFSNVMSGVDAELKLKKFSRNDIVMQSVDLSGLGWDKALQPKFGVAGSVGAHQDWYVEFELNFFKAGTNQKQSIQKFDLTALDVDGDGQDLAEYVHMDNPTSVSYSTFTALVGSTSASTTEVCPEDGISSPVITCPTCHGTGRTSIAVAPLPPVPGVPPVPPVGPVGPAIFLCDDCNGTGKIYQACQDAYNASQQATGPVQNFANIDTSATEVMATYHYTDKDKITFRIGAKTNNIGTSGDAGIRLNSLWYRQFNLAPAMVLPVKLTGFTAVRQNNKVMLDWGTSSEKNFDHFNVQRSTDGKQYQDIALVFAGEETSGVRNYQYRDAVASNSAPVLFYRLQIVDRSGEISYSPVRMIRLDQATELAQISVAPNPVTDELHLTLPAAWQGKAVTVEVYSINGIRMQQVQIGHASQTEELHLGSLPKGAYLIKAINGDQTLQQRVIRQ